ncbi:hypothetical protein [Rhodopseudomonas sp. B29]|uniref:hypothetical protein n=1 Tax=Rhodopseudomonas sp. B29 TaxID=95607 RepID=UPI000348D4AA|nr:hypothetical protein [Rhodopseudomonas sp. B29]
MHEAQFNNQLAVVYLARFAEGPKPLAAFIASYRKHPAGCAHDLVVVRKGFPDAPTPQDKQLAALNAHIISVSDDGFDINAYAAAAQKLPHQRVAFFNTFSEILADDWLRKLDAAMSRPGVGIAGATGSYESLHSSMRRVNEGWWRFRNHILPLPAAARRVFRTLRKLLPKALVQKLLTRIVTYFAAGIQSRDPDRVVDPEFEAYWAKELQPGGGHEFLNHIQDFPNVHIRTNGFVIDRRMFLDANPGAIVTKIDSYLFESGPDSLTRQVMRRGLEVVVVGADGNVYGVDQWPRSGTFRQGDQRNLLVSDNQTRAFGSMDGVAKTVYADLTWGGEHEARPV